MSQGSETFPSNITLQSTLTDASGEVGTAGQVLSSTGSGTNWISATSGSTYISYAVSATLSTAVNPTLLVVVSGALVGKVITIPTGYPVGQNSIRTNNKLHFNNINGRNYSIYWVYNCNHG